MKALVNTAIQVLSYQDVPDPVPEPGQSLIRVRRTETGMEYDELRSVRFVPLVEGLARE